MSLKAGEMTHIGVVSHTKLTSLNESELIDGSVFERTLLQATEKYMAFTRADKSLDYGHLQTFQTEAQKDFEAIPELWKLQNLCVHVNHQRRGLGSRFLRWGKAQAEREGVPIGLESAEAARPTYLKNGFRVYAYMHIESFPIEEVPIFLWEPKSMEGQWGTDEKPKPGWEDATASHPSMDDTSW